MSKSTTESKELRVALNPGNPEAGSWYDPSTGTNLFLSTPQSDDLGHFSYEELEAVRRGIKSGILIVSRGELPEGIDINEVQRFGAPRARWATEVREGMTEEQIAAAHSLQTLQKQAQSNWASLQRRPTAAA